MLTLWLDIILLANCESLYTLELCFISTTLYFMVLIYSAKTTIVENKIISNIF